MFAKFPHLSPLAKILVWLGIVGVLATMVQTVAWLAGNSFNILASGNGGRGVLLALALSGLLAMIALDRRPISEFGLFVGPRWKKLWFTGLAIGATTYVAYVLLLLAVGGYDLSFARVSPTRVGKGLFAGMTSMPLSLVQQILFSGYLLGMLRQRYSRVAAVVIPAFMFAVMGRLNNPMAVLEPSAHPLIIGLFLVAALLGTLRLLTGSILLPAGLLAGWMFVRRVLDKTALVVPDFESVWAPWLVPRADTRQGPVMWLLLAAGIGGCWWALRRRGEAALPEHTTVVDADFKRVFPLFHGSVLAPLDIWFERLVAARFRIGWVYLPRLIVALVLSALNTVLSLPERLLLPWLLRRHEVQDPVFILGLQRTGTTHLHNLLALDPQFCTTRAYHIFNPVGFLFSGWLFAPLLQAFLPWKRPMDSVRFHLFTPNEEEFVMAGACGISPYWGMSFPRQWPYYDQMTYIDQLPAAQQARWKRHYRLFLKKLTWFSGKRPLLKSPNNTGRVAVLSDMFPRARFVHLFRDPEVVYLSNM
ncbi:MAG: sulfotransferase, partial [Planctomycetota bacterium]|nr:sulfotransferase [Planctomycetota bacterium]